MFAKIIMAKHSVGGLKVDDFTKEQFLQELASRLAQGRKTFVTTVYSEFLYAALRDKAVMDMLNKADIAVPDGIGILWAERFLSLPFSVKNYYFKIVQAFWQMVCSGAGVLLRPRSVYQVFPEKITGADVVWDIARLAAENKHSLYLLGGFRETPKIAAQKLQQKFPGLVVAGTSNKHPDDQSVLDDLKAVKPDVLLVAYGPIRQEQWIVRHYEQLPAKLMIGLGGTFDYIAGKKLSPPKFIRRVGLEWLYRLLTQPKRVKRIIRATLGLITALMRYKVFDSLHYRRNVACVVFNKNKEILICQRNPSERGLRSIGDRGWKKNPNYWQFPQGGIDNDESIEKAALRELQEETGIISAKVLKVSDHINRYSYTQAKRPLLFNDAHRKGQEQNLVYLLFTGLNSEIRPDNNEFIAFRWAKPEKLLAELHPERHSLALFVLDDLNHRKVEFTP